MSGIRSQNEGFVASQTQLLHQAVNGLDVYNKNPDPLVNMLCEPYYKETVRVAQAPLGFERGGDGGPPNAKKVAYRLLSLPFETFDVAAEWTKAGLQDALESDVNATVNAAMAGDAELVNGMMFAALFTKRTAGSNGTAYRASFWNGETDVPSFGQNTFASAHYHYKGINTTTLAGDHVIEAIEDLNEHGFGMTPGSLVGLFNPAQQSDVMPILGSTSFPALNGLQTGIIGTGIRSYNVELIFSAFVPAGYFAIVDKTAKPLAMREHLNPEYRGLQIHPGTNPKDPLEGAWFMRRIGFGARILGGATMRQIVASTTYTNPTLRFS